MENKYNVEELEKQYLEMSMGLDAIKEKLDKARKEEEEAKQAKLEEEKEARKKELDEAFERFNKLRNAFVRDYGWYSTSSSESFKDIDSIIEKLYGFRWI